MTNIDPIQEDVERLTQLEREVAFLKDKMASPQAFMPKSPPPPAPGTWEAEKMAYDERRRKDAMRVMQRRTLEIERIDQEAFEAQGRLREHRATRLADIKSRLEALEERRETDYQKHVAKLYERHLASLDEEIAALKHEQADIVRTPVPSVDDLRAHLPSMEEVREMMQAGGELP